MAVCQAALPPPTANDTGRIGVGYAYSANQSRGSLPDGGYLLLESLERTHAPEHERDQDGPKPAHCIQHCKFDCLAQTGRGRRREAADSTVK